MRTITIYPAQPVGFDLGSLVGASIDQRGVINDRFHFSAYPIDASRMRGEVYMSDDDASPTLAYEVALRGRRAAFVFCNEGRWSVMASNEDAPLLNATIPALLVAIATAYEHNDGLNEATQDAINAWYAEAKRNSDIRSAKMFGAMMDA